MRFFIEGERKATGESVAMEFESVSLTVAKAHASHINCDRFEVILDDSDGLVRLTLLWTYYLARWLFLLPIALLSAIVLPWLGTAMLYLLSDVQPPRWFVGLFLAGASGWSLVYCGSFAAPHARRKVAVALAALVVLSVASAVILAWRQIGAFQIACGITMGWMAIGAIASVRESCWGSWGNVPWRRTPRRVPVAEYED